MQEAILFLTSSLLQILNGFDAALGIRKLESLKLKSNFERRRSTVLNGRIPILAVSASLHERQKDSIADVGIDGWILKPVDFRRLSSLMRGALDTKVRQEDIYRSVNFFLIQFQFQFPILILSCFSPGGWERGGWLEVPGIDGSRRYA